jgi:hypothetical protein
MVLCYNEYSHTSDVIVVSKRFGFMRVNFELSPLLSVKEVAQLKSHHPKDLKNTKNETYILLN